ncbi:MULTISPECIES: hypothetical protein [unclassified Chelatococcus]|uniref:hypothetical protein n=1 Tax=unclassified Chelatococcus TaxID=2638111 RepID=UPI001BCC53B2|nr:MULTISPECIES: hypothetical protein [unclassified Chelatococcus]MBS7737917.1 hypothetical protein [Chelatococcus sp. HY11]MCO5079371.1 hypothetical protein [Chelatococcus sp.]
MDYTHPGDRQRQIMLGYVEWLHEEMLHARAEAGLAGCVPCGTIACTAHMDAAPPSTRAESVLRLAGVDLPAVESVLAA